MAEPEGSMANAVDTNPLIDIDEDEGVADLENVSTISLRPSLMEPVYCYGRRYQGYRDGEYLRPNDDEELDRLDLTNEVFFLLKDEKLHLAPVNDGLHRILDIGTGTGSWAIAIGDKYPSAEVIGIDISDTLPTWVPPNTRFEIADIEDEWTFSAPFDFIHCRYLTGSIKDWPQLIQRTFENLRPGGWAEFTDLDIDIYSQDGTLEQDNSFKRCVEISSQAMEDLGKTIRPGKRLKGWMRDVGFVNLQAVRTPAPVGPWPKDKKLKRVGLLNLVQLHNNLSGLYVRLFCDVLGWRREDFDALIVEARNDMQNSAVHSMFDIYTVWGQKSEGLR